MNDAHPVTGIRVVPIPSNAIADISGEVKRRFLTGLNGEAARRDRDEC